MSSVNNHKFNSWLIAWPIIILALWILTPSVHTIAKNAAMGWNEGNLQFYLEQEIAMRKDKNGTENKQLDEIIDKAAAIGINPIAYIYILLQLLHNNNNKNKAIKSEL